MTITNTRRGEYAKLAFEVLKKAGGDLKVRELCDSMEKQLTLTDEEKHVYDNGYPRWNVQMRFASTGWAKAGFIRKKKGRWFLTPEGEALMSQSPDAIQDAISEGYNRWRDQRDDQSGDPSLDDAGETSIQETPSLVLEDAEDRAREEIREYVAAMGPYEFQDLVAALLRGMGYVTPFIAPKGPDGGTDVLAYLDPLGAKTPHIRVQVKHRQDKAQRSEVSDLQGNIRRGREIGLFVSAGGFTPDAKRQQQKGEAHIELVDLDQFIELWIEHYPKLDDEDRARLPLRMVSFLAPQ